MRKHSVTYDVHGSIDGKIIDGKARLLYLSCQSDVPKTYKKIGVISRYVSEYSYESGLITIFKAKDNTLRFETYHSGNFYPYYGMITFENMEGL